ncbi:MAG: ATP-dependent DNA helicase RecG, partial [Rhodobacteraceae bacterium]|nr:ATP-dependent DNA helicase RecG [Paracoccaceae bacterium]
MSTRPEILYPLFAELTSLDGVGPKIAQNFQGLNVERPRDLILTLPHNGIDRRLVDTVQGADFPSVLTLKVKVLSHKPARNKSGAYRVTVEDAKTAFQLVFF